MIIVIDLGSQYVHLIARRIREIGVYSEIFHPSISVEELSKLSPQGVILSGGPGSVYDDISPGIEFEILDFLSSNKIPVLGICYGHQLLAFMLGGRVEPGKKREYGKKLLFIKTPDSSLFEGWEEKETVWMSHGDQVIDLPPDLKVTAYTDDSPIAAFESFDMTVFGVQFHPEVKHTPKGLRILENFALKICGCEPSWGIEDFIRQSARKLREEVGDEKVLMGVSGGIDSSTAALILHKAVGDNLHCVFIDNGLMRKEEVEQVLETFRDKFKFKQFHFVDTSERFLEALKGVIDPEEKRKTVAELFIKVFEEKAEELSKEYGEFNYLGQGTIYPDRIESAQPSREAAKIKSHHNVVLPSWMRLKVVEPIRDLYKDEVRAVAERLDLPQDLVWRHPFPGPGLAVRCLGEVTLEKLEILREADDIVVEEIKEAGFYRDLWQAFAILLPVKSVGVMGDFRTYDYIVAVRAVISDDAMTADWAKLPYELLEKIANRIVNEVRGVNRVLYDITQKPPSTIEFE
ncbi:MAG: glutamine-hydrolyzing GMP synthase [Candidatus Wukongarchaeota archaeon]|nr:glutamine-hydrolyzing GMP synthase [Candidatus Wukongarchaeota archaeon]